MHTSCRPLPPHFLLLLQAKAPALVTLFHELRAYIWQLFPAGNELLYHTHALTAVYSISDKLADAYCMIPVYTHHLHLGFNKGTLLPDPHQCLTGTDKLIRHVPVTQRAHFENQAVTQLVQAAIAFALKNTNKPCTVTGTTLSKIKMA